MRKRAANLVMLTVLILKEKPSEWKMSSLRNFKMILPSIVLKVLTSTLMGCLSMLTQLQTHLSLLTSLRPNIGHRSTHQ